MASWQAHAASLLLKATLKRKLRHAADPATAWAALEGCPRPRTGHASQRGWRARRVAGTGGALRTLLYLHGGGYVACSPRTHRPITQAFAKAGLRVFAPDYRLAREHLYSAALDDAVAAWRVPWWWGDSAGGLPPLLVHVGESEMLLDDSTRLAARRCAAGVAVETKTWPAVPHVWQIMGGFIPEGRQSLDAAARFLLAELIAGHQRAQHPERDASCCDGRATVGSRSNLYSRACWPRLSRPER